MASGENTHIHGEIVMENSLSTGTKPKVQKDGQYSDPLFKKLSKINGEINKLPKNELQRKLKDKGLDSRGVKEVLKKRLKNYYKRRKLMKSKIRAVGGTKYDYLAVIDFEATCDENNTRYRHEIIEFPVILVDVEKMEIVDKFHEYVRPYVNPKLTDFCTQLTGITQAVVDGADSFPDVLSRVEDWMNKHRLGFEKSFAVLTDGPWDMFRFMYYQCKESHITMPLWSKKWVNVRKSYCNFYQCGRGGIEVMLQNLGMKFEGTLHRGIDDATNIARIAIKMLGDGCALNINEHIQINLNQNPYDPKPEVRYEPVIDSDSDDGNENDGQSGKGDESGMDNSKKIRRILNDEHIVTELGALSIKEAIPQQGDDIDDLLSYYKLQTA